MPGAVMKVSTGQLEKSNHLNNFLTILKLPIMSKVTVQKYYDALCDLKRIGSFTNAGVFCKERNIGKVFVQTCLDLKILSRINRNTYQCIDFSPSFELAKNVRDICYDYNKNWLLNSKANLVKKEQKQKPVSPSMTIEEMIKALKSEGYKIFKPVTEFQEL
jgi:hypothetical protein